MIVYDPAHQAIDIDDPEHEGGEGWICPVLGQPARMAKIYKPQQNLAGRENKLRWMLDHPPADPGRAVGHASIAWPETLLYDRQGAFLGFLMPRVANVRSLLNVYNPRLRTQTLIHCDGFFLHRVARNLAAAVGALHAGGYMIGDLNENNTLVTASALVTIIDVDSFQAREQRDGQIIVFPCPVGRPEYTPPELQKRHLMGEVRQPEQDAFGLAVLIFQILLDGSHPFRSVWLGGGEPPPVEDKIERGLFPFSNPSAVSIVAPPPSFTLDRLHPRLVSLIYRCFVEGHFNPKRRPPAPEWEEALRVAEKLLCVCPNRHVYSSHLPACPQCSPPAHPPGNVAKASPPGVIPGGQAPLISVLVCADCHMPISAPILYCPTCEKPVAPRICIYCGFNQVPQQAACCPRCGMAP